MDKLQSTNQLQALQTSKLVTDFFEVKTTLKEIKLVFNNEENDKIPLTELVNNYKKVIKYSSIFHNIEVSVEDESIYIFIVETAPGEACDCCRGSGRKNP